MLEKAFFIGSDYRMALFDDCDSGLLKSFPWYVISSKVPYIVARVNRANIYAHRIIADAPKDLVVDHINGNTLDNRRKNLRVCTQAENTLNNRGWTKLRTPEKFKGVWRIARATGNHGGNLFESKISIEGVQRYIGSYKTAEEAAKAYDDYARSFHGRYAALNFPEKNENGIRQTEESHG